MTIGYVRVSTSKQHPANQLEEIQRFADTRSFVIDRFVIEIVSGRTAEKDRKLGALLRRMKKGDTLIVTEISRLSRTMTEIMSIMGRCLERGINLYTTKEGYTFDNSINSKVLCFAFGLVAEIERNLISMRTKEALMLRRAEGVTLGRRHGSYTKTSILIDNKPPRHGNAGLRMHHRGNMPVLPAVKRDIQPPATHRQRYYHRPANPQET